MLPDGNGPLAFTLTQSKTLAEINGLLRWLKQSNQAMVERIPEMQTAAVQQVASAAIKLASGKYDNARSLEELQAISNRLIQVASKHGYPMMRR